jgi:hypothetical protein
MHFTASHWVRWIWLLYTAFFFIEPINRHNLRYWLIFAGCYAIFLALYFGINFTRTAWQRALITAMFLEGMLYVPFNGGALGMFVFAAAFLPFCVESISLVLLLFAGGCATIVLEAWLLRLPFWSWLRASSSRSWLASATWPSPREDVPIPNCGWPRRKWSSSPNWPNASASPATCTTFSDIPSR